MKAKESGLRVFSRSPTLCQSPNFLKSTNFRKSISPKRYFIGNDLIDSKNVKNLNNSSRSYYNNSFCKGIRSSDNINKLLMNPLSERQKKQISSPRYNNPLIGIRKQSPVTKPLKNFSYAKSESACIAKYPKAGLKSRISEFKSKLNSAMFSEEDSVRFTDENFLQKAKVTHNKSISTSNKPRIPLAPKQIPPIPKAKLQDKRKLPARYLLIETPEISISKEPHTSYLEMDLKLIQATSAESLLKNLEAEKKNRIHKEMLKKFSILKNVNEEESWDWSSPEKSPVKRKVVHFENNI